MKNLSSFLALAIISINTFSIFSMEDLGSPELKRKKKIPDIHFHLNQENYNLNENENNLKAKVDVKQEQTNINNSGDARIALLSAFGSWINNNKVLICAGGIASGYVYLRSYVTKVRTYLHNKQTWSAWRADIPVEQLNTPAIAKELLYDALLRHLNTAALSDSFASLSLFFEELKKEQTLLETFLRYTRRFKRLHIHRLFRITDKDITNAQEKLKRVKHLRAIAASGVAQHHYQQMMHILTTSF